MHFNFWAYLCGFLDLFAVVIYGVFGKLWKAFADGCCFVVK